MVSQDYRTNVLEASVLSSNSAILKCEIPSFVTDFVQVTSWVQEETGEEFYATGEIGTKFFLLHRHVHYIISHNCFKGLLV